ncbi:MAG: sigma-54 dependent transcriptional regulator [Candidatus Marinimicrobia bacterium]|nr:sigma-54 dependent transcriptional regulator [Candidatus Neomarinimicrobiota bacterium]MCF7829974.1 sigma-54 dependent transcriptional regulator [Candidatus Neomarinimicrobiota bacterium]MCF7881872.1 sigma-54 dependent transcriptional regulator [Candidatus Neomarinimicrobiota bacterium]
MKGSILIADDEQEIRESLSVVLEDEGYNCTTAEDGAAALERVEEANFDILIADIKMPNLDGMELVEKTNQISPQTMSIIITAYATVETAVRALRSGASDYILKPLDFDEVIMRVKHLMDHREMEMENQYLRDQVDKKFNFNNIIGDSPAMRDVYQMVKRVSQSTTNVLITGKTGTGKELVARAIHANSDRANKPFIPINCGAIPDNLFESELFGYKKGAFTGANTDKDGVFKTANSGTLFLDEVAEIPLHVQVKLLRAIETKEVKPLGTNTTINIDVRLVAATNKTLIDEVEAGNFREDLYYRLNIIELKLPSLSERKEDIPLLVKHFVEKYNRELKRDIKGVDNETMKTLMHYRWKGQVRELENVIERAVLLCDDDYISQSDLPPSTNQDINDYYPDDLKEATKNFERQHISALLRRCDGDKKKASDLLNIGLSSLYRKIEELDVAVP